MPNTDKCQDDDYVSVGEAARLLGVHEETIRRAERRGQIEAGRTPGGHRRFRVGDLRALLATEPAEPGRARQVRRER